MANDDPTQKKSTSTSTRPGATTNGRDRQALIERAKREVPALRERVAVNLAEIRRLTKE